jgi:hypothetical protein
VKNAICETRHRQSDNITIDLKEVSYEETNWTELALNKRLVAGFVTKVMKLR